VLFALPTQYNSLRSNSIAYNKPSQQGSKPSLIPKFSQAVRKPRSSKPIQSQILISVIKTTYETCDGETQNGANRRLFGASKALRNYGPKRLRFSFWGPFFGSFFGQAKNEQIKKMVLKLTLCLKTGLRHLCYIVQ
jgi:hypothetical protein